MFDSWSKRKTVSLILFFVGASSIVVSVSGTNEEASANEVNGHQSLEAGFGLKSSKVGDVKSIQPRPFDPVGPLKVIGDDKVLASVLELDEAMSIASEAESLPGLLMADLEKWKDWANLQYSNRKMGEYYDCGTLLRGMVGRCAFDISIVVVPGANHSANGRFAYGEAIHDGDKSDVCKKYSTCIISNTWGTEESFPSLNEPFAFSVRYRAEDWVDVSESRMREKIEHMKMIIRETEESIQDERSRDNPDEELIASWEMNLASNRADLEFLEYHEVRQRNGG